MRVPTQRRTAKQRLIFALAMVTAVQRTLLAAALALAACSNPDNLIIGGISPGPQTPLVVFDNINSAINGTVTLTDQNGNPTGQSAVVIISDRPQLCDRLKANPSYFRAPVEAFEAMILFMPPGFLGTFVIGRGGDQDVQASSEIIATGGFVLGPVTKGVTNAGTGSISLSGSPASGYSKIVINITAAGDPGSAKFQYSLDGGATFSQEQTIPAGGAFPLDVTGVTVTFAPGTSGTSFAAR